MSTRTFEEFFKAVYVRVGFVSSKDELREAWDASRAALLADRPGVAKIMVLVDDYADQLCSALRDDGGIGVADGLVAKLKKDAVRSALESLAAQLDEREAECAEYQKALHNNWSNHSDQIIQLRLRAEKAEAERDALKVRLEIDHATDGNGNRVPFPDGAPDGIACRDQTIKLLEERVDALKEDAERLRGYAEELAEGLADFIEFFHNYQGQKWEDANAALRAYRAAYPKEPAR